MSTARHLYMADGVYRVRVLVSNHLYTTPVEGVLPFNFTVCYPIVDLGIALTNDNQAAAKLQRDHTGNASTQSIQFRARFDSYTDIARSKSQIVGRGYCAYLTL